MNAKQAKSWATSIVRQREFLVRSGKCKKNASLMASITTRLALYLNAYPYEGPKIFQFIRNHYTDFLLIIPANRSEQKNLQILNEIALWKETNTNKNALNTTDAQLQLQLQ